MINARELVSRCLKNDAVAQKQLYQHYAPQMLAICYRYTKDADEASDVMQDGFVRMFRNLGQWKEEGELGAWIRKIMVNTALNWIRSKKRVQWVNEDNISENFNSDAVITPASRLEAKELADLIRKLPFGYQTIFNLHAIEGYSHVEISKMLDISEGTCRSQYLRARHFLADMILKTEKEKLHYAGKQ